MIYRDLFSNRPPKRILPRGRVKEKERGASYLEAMIGIPLLILFIVFVVDSGRFLLAYARLTYVAAEATRAVAIAVGRAGVTGGCDPLQVAAEGALENFFVQRPNLQFGFSAQSVQVTPSEPFPVIRVGLGLEVSCIVCRIYSDTVTLDTSSVLVVESALTGCH